ncbi:hypothetical protein FSP39_009056 [Pinctada imbricata]|uniref:Uncharacterized protein n=1 Tax=Pinctada imbricata TaxID=66713 RepID=A0AA89BLS2_PINIB|nr:hypothetical protein FSP39_009056 [Pinctada imbricata]
MKRASSINTRQNITKTIIRKEPAKQKDWRQEIHLSPLEIATIGAICLLIVGALVYCIYQYISYCCRNKNKIQRVNSSESLSSSRNWKSIRRGSRDSDGRWSRSSNGSVDNWMGDRKWAY